MWEAGVPCKSQTKVAIIGAGAVGSTTAYALMIDGAATEIALIDIKKDKVEGEALDLAHCMQFTPKTTIVAGDSFDLVQGARIIIITAGAAQQQGEKRTDLLEKNTLLFKEIIPEIVRYNNEAIFLIVSNPVDVLTYLTVKISGLSSCQVFGSGTVLDTARLRYLIGEQLNISPKDITAYILGEHGDSEFVWWSHANIAGMPIAQLTGNALEFLTEIYQKTKNAAYEIISKKGMTNYAIALVLSKIVKAILQDQSRIFTVSSLVHNYLGVDDVCLSVPTVIRKSGVCERFMIDLSDEELRRFRASGDKIRQEIKRALELLKE